MFDLQSVGKLMILFGLSLAVVGGLFWALGRLGAGNLPGNINIQGDGWGCFVPITASIVISLLLTLVLNIVLRMLNK